MRRSRRPCSRRTSLPAGFPVPRKGFSSPSFSTGGNPACVPRNPLRGTSNGGYRAGGTDSGGMRGQRFPCTFATACSRRRGIDHRGGGTVNDFICREVPSLGGKLSRVGLSGSFGLDEAGCREGLGRLPDALC